MGIRARRLFFVLSATLLACGGRIRADTNATPSGDSDAAFRPVADAGASGLEPGAEAGSSRLGGFDGGGAASLPVRLVLIGDSITAGVTGVVPWPDDIGPILPSRVTLVNLAVAGEPLNIMVSTAATAIYPKVDPDALDVAVIFGGINDLRTNTTGAVTYARLSQLVAGCRAHGFALVYVFTITPEGTGSCPQAEWQAYNDAIKAGALAGGYSVIDLGADPYIGAWAAAKDPAWFLPDTIHPNTQGETRIASIAYRALFRP